MGPPGSGLSAALREPAGRDQHPVQPLDSIVEPPAGHVSAASRGEAPLAPRAARELLAARSEERHADRSKREREVLGLVAEGLPNKLIARRLEISEKTVKAHRTSIFQRIGITDRTQAALWAQRHGVSADADGG